MQAAQRHHHRHQCQDDEIHRQDVEIVRLPGQGDETDDRAGGIGDERRELLGELGHPEDMVQQASERDDSQHEAELGPVDLPDPVGDARAAEQQAAPNEDAAEGERTGKARTKDEELRPGGEAEAGRDEGVPAVLRQMRHEDDQHGQPAEDIEPFVAPPLLRLLESLSHQNAPS